MSNARKIALKGTEHASLPGARAIGPSDPHQIVEVSVVLKHRNHLPKADEHDRVLNHHDFAKTHGADPAHVDKIKNFARENNLQALERGDEVLRRTVVLAGTAAAMEKAFAVELNEFEYEDGSYRGFAGAVQIPEDFASFVGGVFGLDDRPAAHPHFRFRNTNRAFGARASNVAYNPAQLAKLYAFPKDANGAGQTIGFIELGGGYRPIDIRNYFQNLDLQPPAVKCICVDHANNRASSPNSADAQVMLDIEVAGTVAPGMGAAMYFAPNTERGFQDAVSTAIHDQLNKPCVLVIGWGNAEINWTQQSMENFDRAAQEAALLGITICAASGDLGASNGIQDGRSHANFPASSPHVLAIGGTRIAASNGAIEVETAWYDGPHGGGSGGGYSTVFTRPSWQAAEVAQSGRGIPDVAANADPETGYNILVDGHQEIAGGTSPAASLWAGLVVLLNQKLNRHVGFVNPALYSIDQTRGFRDITMGGNGTYASTHGWDPVTGLGSPLGAQLLQALQGASVMTQSPSRETQTATAHERAVAAK